VSAYDKPVTGAEARSTLPVTLIPPEIPLWKRAARSLVRAKWPVLALAILGVVIIMAVFAAQLVPKDPNRQNLVQRLLEPMKPNAEG
jgi:hypothetical protein